MPIPRRRRAAAATLLLVLATAARAELPKVPEGFKARLVATVPAVQSPCQVATAPDGALYVAEDPMDQAGPYESRNGRILKFVEGRDPVVFAEGFRAIFGMAWRDGSLYVSHMPYLTVLKDADGDGKAERRQELFTDLGITKNSGLNDHIVSGLHFGMDGYLYVSVGDKGVLNATGPDGKTAQIIGGGTLRCRPDGTGIEVLTTGTRNHLECNLDERDTLFTYDNTDDGDGWWTRVTHHVDGGYYGYPYDYHSRPDRHLPRMAEYGGGSPCGAVTYKEDVWPEKYRGLAMWAEWGKGKVQGFLFQPEGASYKVAETVDFAVPNGVPNFHPIDLALSYDGRTLYVADWSMGGWGSKTEKVGRVFAITYEGEVKTRPRGTDADPVEAQIGQLDHPSYNERIRAQRALIKRGRDALVAVQKALADPKTPPIAQRHLIWALDGIAGGTPEATGPTIDALRAPVADVRAQAARALGIRKVPIAATPLIALLKDADPAVKLQAIVALGRLGDGPAVPSLLPILADADPFLAFAARVALRRIGDWGSAAEGLKSADPKVRAGVLAALELVYEPEAVEMLASYGLSASRPAAERARALSYLAAAHRKPEPWTGKWWGTRPTQGKPPAKVLAWPGTPRVIGAIRDALTDADPTVRTAAVAAAVETGDRDLLPGLRARFDAEKSEPVRVAAAMALGKLKDVESTRRLAATLRDPAAPESLRAESLSALEAIGSEAAAASLLDLLKAGGLAPEREARVASALGTLKAKSAVGVLVGLLSSPTPVVRAAAAGSLGKLGVLDNVGPKLRAILGDVDLDARKAAIGAVALLKDRQAIPTLLDLTTKEETRFEASLALAAMPEPRALQVYLRGLADRNQDLRRASAAAIAAIRDVAAPTLDQLAGRRELSPSILPELSKIYTAVTPIRDWRLLGPYPLDAAPPVAPGSVIHEAKGYVVNDHKVAQWTKVRGKGKDAEVDPSASYGSADNLSVFGVAEFTSAVARKARLVVGSDDTLTIWVNGIEVYKFAQRRGYQADADAKEVELNAGPNQIMIKCGNAGGPWSFSVAVGGEADYAFLKAPAGGAFDPEGFRKFAARAQGKPDHGKALFADLKGLACVKCHAVGGVGGNVGPELAGIATKYSKDELISSVLYPSARISSGYEPAVIALADGRVVTGIVKADTAEGVELLDAEAKRVVVPKAEIEARKASDVSLMPSGLVEGLSRNDFADLVAYLESLKEAPAKP